jgi:ectoine hydroxylase
MKTEQILSQPALTLTQEQREFYFENGYLLLEEFVTKSWLECLRETTKQVVEQSRQIEVSDAIWDIEANHTCDTPRLRRLTSPNDHHPSYWEFASQSSVVDVVQDLVGSDVKFHHSKLNFKWQRGGEEVKWHQDIQFWPHTNYSPLTIGLYLYDCDSSQGPLLVIPKSHKFDLFNLYNQNDEWVGHIDSKEQHRFDESQAVELAGKAGSITIHNSRLLHASKRNNSEEGRPLLLNAYSSADAMPYTPVPTPSHYYQTIIRGKAARWAHHDPEPCQIPPDWSEGYSSIFSLQKNAKGM